MRRLIGAALVVSLLAITAGSGTARAQTPTPAPAIPWDQAELKWTPPAEFASGGSLADCATGPCGVLYLVEAAVSGSSGWGAVAITSDTHLRVTDMRPGTWQFRVRAFFKGSGYSPAGPVVSKVITEPAATAPPTTEVK
jgi:hypothetical protein